jgi:hypothetical protein
LITLQAAGGSLGRRPPPPPPSSSATAPVDEDSFVPVDNLAHSFVEAYFHEADADRDGRVADEEARNFFLRTGLSPSDLSTIWKIVKPSTAVAHQGKGLSKRRFSQALRLIALVQAQNGVPLTPELATAALLPETWIEKGYDPLPTPDIAPSPPHEKGFFEGLLGGIHHKNDAPLVDVDIHSDATVLERQEDGPVALSQQQPETATDAIVTGLEFLGIEQPVRGLTTTRETRGGELSSGGIVSNNGGQEDLLGLGTLLQEEGEGAEETTPFTATAADPQQQEQHQFSKSRPPSASKGTRPTFASLGGTNTTRSLLRTSAVQSLPRGSRNFVSTSLEAPLAYELRYPPLNPKESAKLSVLIASNGSLFSGPSVENGLLQWSMPEGEVRDGSSSRPGSGGGSFGSSTKVRRSIFLSILY